MAAGFLIRQIEVGETKTLLCWDKTKKVTQTLIVDVVDDPPIETSWTLAGTDDREEVGVLCYNEYTFSYDFDTIANDTGFSIVLTDNADASESVELDLDLTNADEGLGGNIVVYTNALGPCGGYFTYSMTNGTGNIISITLTDVTMTMPP